MTNCWRCGLLNYYLKIITLKYWSLTHVVTLVSFSNENRFLRDKSPYKLCESKSQYCIYSSEGLKLSKTNVLIWKSMLVIPWLIGGLQTSIQRWIVAIWLQSLKFVHTSFLFFFLGWSEIKMYTVVQPNL
jgi:hypothetical protein